MVDNEVLKRWSCEVGDNYSNCSTSIHADIIHHSYVSLLQELLRYCCFCPNRHKSDSRTGVFIDFEWENDYICFVKSGSCGDFKGKLLLVEHWLLYIK